MYKNRSRGFTLIELLVVIAIIGILSAVVLASLNTARSKATDAQIESDLNTVQTQLAIDYSSYPNNYGDTSYNTTAAPATWTVACSGAAGAPGIGLSVTATKCDQALGNALIQASGGASGVNKLQINFVQGNATYVVEAPLTSATGIYWCTDSTGVSKQETAPLLSGATACP
ncbi:MAG: type II secretion system protein [Minisyncoccota bacterium]